MGQTYPLAEHQQQYQRSLCLHPMSGLLLSCFYRASLLLRHFHWGDHRLEVFISSSLCVWSQIPWRNLQIRVLSRGSLHELWTSFSDFDSSKEFSQILVRCGWVAEHDKPYPEVRVIPRQLFCPVSWGCRIHWLHLCRGVRPPLTSVLDMTLNNLMVRFQQCSSFGECGVPLHCHCSQVHSGPEW